MQLIACGRLGRPHGVRGALRIWPHNPQTDLIRAQRVLQIGRSTRACQPLTIASARRDAKGWIVQFDAIRDRDAAAQLTNATWFESREAFSPADDDEVYATDLVGLAVVTAEGDAVGEIVDVQQVGPSDLLVIRGPRGEHLVPNVPAFVQRLDPAAPPAVITPIEGLLDDGADD